MHDLQLRKPASFRISFEYFEGFPQSIAHDFADPPCRQRPSGIAQATKCRSDSFLHIVARLFQPCQSGHHIGRPFANTLANVEIEASKDVVGREPLDRKITLFSRSEEHTSELQSLMRISYDVLCLKKKKDTIIT